MKRISGIATRITGVAVFVCALSIAGCNLFVGPDSDDDDRDQDAPPPTPAELIAAIPTLDNLLPQSLQAGEGSQALSRRRSARAMGDVTELDPDALPGVTAQGYADLRAAISQSMFKQIMEIMKVGIEGKDIPLDQDYLLGEVTLPESIPGPNPDERTMDLGVIRISKPSVTEYRIKWFLRVEMSMGPMSIEVPFWMYIVITDADSVDTMKVKMAMTGTAEIPDFGTMDMSAAAEYDAATKQMTTINLGNYPSKQTLTMDGDVAYYASMSDDYTSIAWANDQMGGVVSNWHDGEYDSINTEFYNADGDLVMTQWGDDGEDSYSWVLDQFTSDYAVDVFALLGGSKPSTLFRRETFEYASGSYNRTVEWSTDNDTWEIDPDQSRDWDSADPWPTDMQYWQTPVWMAGDTPASGDSLYYFRSNEWTPGTWEVDSYSYTSTTTYDIGFTIPTAQQYLGGEYYMQNRFLLKHLTMATELSDAGYTLMMEEGSTWYGWWSDDGEWMSQISEPANWADIPSWDKYSYTSYNFWLENTSYRDEDNEATNLGTTMDADKGDIDLTRMMREDTFYIWENGQDKQLKAYVMDTTEDAPVGFTFDQGALVDTVKTEIEDFFNSLPAFDPTTLEDEADAILVLPALDTFPTYE